MDRLHQIVTSLADSLGLDASSLEPGASERRALLDVARVVAHSSGDRTNAPLLCYVLGRAAAQGADLTAAIVAVEESLRDA